MLTKIPTDPHDAAWGSPGWPEWVTSFRPHQLDAWEEIMGCYANGDDVVLLDAPTGSGKTIIAEGVRRLLHCYSSAYIANTNSLLDQFMGDFNYAVPIKGKVHYPTYDRPDLFNLRAGEALTCADCVVTREPMPACGECPEEVERWDEANADEVKLHCPHCHPFNACPYRVARMNAHDAFLVVTNTSFFISDTKLSINSVLAGRDFVIADECDTLESILMGQIEVNISKRTREELEINPPAKKTVPESWMEWLVEEARPKVKAAIDQHRTKKSATAKWVKGDQRLKRLKDKLDTLELELNAGNVVYDGYDRGDIIFKPVQIDLAAPKMLWNQGKKWLAMSATLFPDEFVDSLGLDHTELNYSTVRVPSTFPVERRPIYYKGIANNVYKERDTAWPAMVDGVERVLMSRPDSRTLIHTVSYGFTNYLAEGLRLCGSLGGRDIIACTKASERGETIERLKRSEGGVLLGPGFDRGIDLPGEHCELIIIVKMPFLSTNDKQVNARMRTTKGGHIWYATQTLKSLVQMTGRGMRSADDLCECFILDQQFLTNVWRSNRRWLPDWWTESVDFASGGGV